MTDAGIVERLRRLDPVAVACTAATSLATLVVGLIGIGRSFNYDEAVTYTSFINGGSVRVALTEQVVFNNHQMFSAIQAVAWRVGIVGESAQRLGPVLCGVAAVGLLTWWITRRVGWIAGLTSGALLLLGPIYVVEFRNLRGYSLSTLAALVAVLAIHRSWVDRRRRWIVVAAVAMFVAVTTHVYAVLPVVLAASTTAVLGKLRREHVVSWALAAAATVLVQLPLLDDARRNGDARGRRYLPGFLRFTVEQYLGGRRAAVIVVGGLVVLGLLVLARRSRRHALAIAAAAGILFAVVMLLWQVVRPYDLYTRFFVSLTPYLAAAAGVGAQSVPRRAGLVPAVIAIALLAPRIDRVTSTEPPIRDAAVVVDAARAAGVSVCGTDTIALAVYTPPVPEVDVTEPDGPGGFAGCEVFVAVLGVPRPGRDAVAARFPVTVAVRDGLTIHTTNELASQVGASLADR